MTQPKVVLITGASSGIGAELARQLAFKGARLALAARRAERLEAVADELRRGHGAEVLVLPTDLRRKEAVLAMVDAAVRRFGRLDVLVNNAGLLRMAPLLATEDAEVRDLWDTNFWPILWAIQAAAPVMAGQGGGHVVNVGSGVGRRGLPFMAAYVATKFALTGFAESARLELAPLGIALTTVYPGGVETEMPRNVDRARLPAGYPSHERSRISAARAARAIVRALATRPLEVYVPWWLRPAAWFCTIWPGLADKLVRSRFKKALAEERMN